ncbi:tyrosine-type recombinase/integrase [Natronomonas sp.]|uniref:tyrosine-type recombinase/integrase n=1 Tax=Natronomonas sp. TaxID=2184060 RepID=UPI003975675E
MTARKSEVSQSTLYEHTTRLNRFVEWCEKEGLTNLNELTTRKCRSYLDYRQEEVAPTTLENEMRTFRLAVQEWEALDGVPEGLSKKVKVPSAKKGYRSREVKVSKDHAQGILAYLNKYEYASLRHVMFALFWHTGCRTGGLRSLDLQDYYPDRYRKPLLAFNHRPETGTPLKKEQWGEREVPISDEMGTLIDDYIEGHRHDVAGENGREPLLTTTNGRPQKTTIQRNIYTVTRPCYIGFQCPEKKDPEECEWTKYNQASKCPDTVSPHGVRRGFVTKMRDMGADFDTIGDRVDASPRTLREHYDTPTPQEKRDRQLEWVDKV